eukprot:619835-Amphidinium_carterae.1
MAFEVGKRSFKHASEGSWAHLLAPFAFWNARYAKPLKMTFDQKAVRQISRGEDSAKAVATLDHGLLGLGDPRGWLHDAPKPRAAAVRRQRSCVGVCQN